MPSSSGNKKTIQINHEFFKIGKKGLNAVSNKQTQKQEKKKHNKTVKHNTIKKELVKRIQQLKQQEKNAASKGGSDDIVDNVEKSEFDESMKYLQSLANNKNAERKRARKKEREQQKNREAALEQSGGNYVQNPTIQNNTPKNKTMKTSALYQQYGLDMNTDANTPMNVNVDLPSELQVNIPSTNYPINKQKMDTSPSIKLDYTPPPVPTHNIITPLKHTSEPPYSNLKGSNVKPTFRQWNKTKKNRSHHSSGGSSIKSSLTKLNEREQKLEMIKNKFQDKSKNLSSNVSSGNEILELKRFYTKSKGGSKSKSRRKTIKRTIKQKYTVGKSGDRRKISVLVKNMKTRKRVQEAKKKLKSENLLEIKRFLKERGLLKSGSSAPNDVLRAMYESAMLAGDIHNLNIGTKIHNYLDEDDTF
jgi:hypothetical protein